MKRVEIEEQLIKKYSAKLGAHRIAIKADFERFRWFQENYHEKNAKKSKKKM